MFSGWVNKVVILWLTGNCDFETDQCSWSAIDNGLYKWSRLQAGSTVGATAPSTDHTTGTGFFMFVDSTGGTFQTSAILQSPTLGDVGARWDSNELIICSWWQIHRYIIRLQFPAYMWIILDVSASFPASVSNNILRFKHSLEIGPCMSAPSFCSFYLFFALLVKTFANLFWLYFQ